MLATCVRTAVLYLIVIICMRIMGKRQVGELQPSELVVTILISELASIPMQDLNRPISNGVIAILVLVVLELLLSAGTLKSLLIRNLFSGKSAILIKNGEIDQRVMKKLRITIDDLLESLRQNGYFDLSEVDYAIMETSGKMSVLPKTENQNATKSDVGIETDETGFPTVIISDGKILKKVFTQFSNVKMRDVQIELKRQSIDVQDVFLMTVDEKKNFITVKKESVK